MSLTEFEIEQSVSVLKFLFGTVLLGCLTTRVNAGLKERALDVEDRKLQAEIALEEQKHLATFLEHALDKNVGKRIRMAEYFTDVTQSVGLKEGWLRYLDRVTKEYDHVKEELERSKTEIGRLQKLASGRSFADTEGDFIPKLVKELQNVQDLQEQLAVGGRIIPANPFVSQERWLARAYAGTKDLMSGNFEDAQLASVDLSRANLMFANLKGANLSGAMFSAAQLSYARLDGANLSGADLRAALGLSKEQVASAYAAPDNAPLLPEGWEPPPLPPASLPL